MLLIGSVITGCTSYRSVIQSEDRIAITASPELLKTLPARPEKALYSIKFVRGDRIELFRAALRELGSTYQLTFLAPQGAYTFGTLVWDGVHFSGELPQGFTAAELEGYFDEYLGGLSLGSYVPELLSGIPTYTEAQLFDSPLGFVVESKAFRALMTNGRSIVEVEHEENGKVQLRGRYDLAEGTGDIEVLRTGWKIEIRRQELNQ